MTHKMEAVLFPFSPVVVSKQKQGKKELMDL
jgi:hypothetical protein